jgi:hypothetical protein
MNPVSVAPASWTMGIRYVFLELTVLVEGEGRRARGHEGELCQLGIGDRYRPRGQEHLDGGGHADGDGDAPVSRLGPMETSPVAIKY